MCFQPSPSSRACPALQVSATVCMSFAYQDANTDYSYTYLVSIFTSLLSDSIDMVSLTFQPLMRLYIGVALMNGIYSGTVSMSAGFTDAIGAGMFLCY